MKHNRNSATITVSNYIADESVRYARTQQTLGTPGYPPGRKVTYPATAIDMMLRASFAAETSDEVVTHQVVKRLLPPEADNGTELGAHTRALVTEVVARQLAAIGLNTEVHVVSRDEMGQPSVTVVVEGRVLRFLVKMAVARRTLQILLKFGSCQIQGNNSDGIVLLDRQTFSYENARNVLAQLKAYISPPSAELPDLEPPI
jgi:hypothetical protein